MATYLTPDYLNIDFDTLVSNLKDQLQDSDVFTDLDYEGSNISVLVELFAYIAELNTYYNNKLAKNQYIDTADVYNNVHRLSSFIGYKPHGYISATGTITLTASGSGWEDKKFLIDEWTQFSTEDVTDENGDPIYFATTETVTTSADSNGSISMDLPVKQGKIIKYTDDLTETHRKGSSFSGTDLVDNKLYLPFLDFGFDNDIDDESYSVRVFVDDVEWTRIYDFYDDITGLTSIDNVYTFNYNKYKEYVVEFSENRNTPNSNDTIEIWLLESLGADGNVTRNSVTAVVDEDIITNETDETTESNENIISVTNATYITGGTDPETIESIRENTKSIAHTQYRDVTGVDYKAFLELHSQVEKAKVWGEQEENPNGGSVFNYNKVFISMIPSQEPSQWDSILTMNTHTTENGSTLYIPQTNGFTSNFKDTISTYLEPRKMVCAYEEYIVPEMIYFAFHIGLKIKRTYKYINTLRDLKDKLEYYFDASNREFGETLEFTDLIYKMLDTSYVSTNNNFTKTSGIQNIVIRDIEYFDTASYSWKSINNDTVYPMWSDEWPSTYNPSSWDQNNIRNILLSRKQFPFIDMNQCVFLQE